MLTSNSYFYMFYLDKNEKKPLIIATLKKSINNAPTIGITKNAIWEYLYLSVTLCIFAIPFGVAPSPNPTWPAESTAES